VLDWFFYLVGGGGGGGEAATIVRSVYDFVGLLILGKMKILSCGGNWSTM